MYIHLGRDYVLNDRDIIGIFNLETTTITPRGREFLNYAQKNGAVVSLSDELPQSYVLADGAVVDTVYLSELSPAAMRRRAEKMVERHLRKTGGKPTEKEGWESPGTARKAAPHQPERPLRAAGENTTKLREKRTPWCTGSRFAII